MGQQLPVELPGRFTGGSTRATYSRGYAPKGKLHFCLFLCPLSILKCLRFQRDLMNADLKLGIGQREPAMSKVEPECQMREHMETNRNTPDKMKKLFNKPSVNSSGRGWDTEKF